MGGGLFLTEEEFHQAQCKRLCAPGMPEFSGAWVQAFWQEALRRFKGLPSHPNKRAVLELFGKTPQDQVGQLFGALAKSVKTCPPTNYSETVWVKELAAYAAMRWLDFSIWSDLPCWFGEQSGKENAITVDLPAVPGLLSHIAMAGLLGRPWRITQHLGVAGAVDLSQVQFGTGVADEVLIALYDEMAGQEVDWPRRNSMQAKLTLRESARLRQKIWEAQGFGDVANSAHYFGVQVSLQGLSTDAKQSVLQGVAHAMNTLVLNVAPESAADDASLENLVNYSGVDVYDIAEHVQGILKKLRYFEEPRPDVAADEKPEEMPTGKYLWEIFLSHASEDKEEVVTPLFKALEKAGWRVWYDKESMPTGPSLPDAINKGLMKSRHMVAVVSPRYLEKAWTMAELNVALRKDPNGVDGRLFVVRFDLSAEQLDEKNSLAASFVSCDAQAQTPTYIEKKLAVEMKKFGTHPGITAKNVQRQA